MLCEGICKLFDLIDTFAILRTGMGRTGFLCIYMLVLLEILNNQIYAQALRRKNSRTSPAYGLHAKLSLTL